MEATAILVTVFGAGALVAGYMERRRHGRRLQAVPIRVNVNGSRGKSTVTRLLIGVFAEAGFDTVGKTTGTQARLILNHEPDEEPIQRRLEGPNIREQKNVGRRAAERGADALVSECMAIVPEYQQVLQEDLLQANIVVLTNVLEDHLDEMGPTTDEVAQAFAATIPSGGSLVVAKGPYHDYFTAVAEARGTTVHVADPSLVADTDVAAFDHLVFPEHVALCLAVAEAVGIDEATALEGMKRSRPDPFATRLVQVGSAVSPACFVSAFSANDPVSTLGIWEHLRDLGYPGEGLVVVINCRSDRWERSEQFARDVLPALPAETIVAIGDLTVPIVRAHDRGELGDTPLIDLQGREPGEVYDTVRGLLDSDGAPAGRVVLGVGNLHTAAIPLIEAFDRDAGASAEEASDVRD